MFSAVPLCTGHYAPARADALGVNVPPCGHVRPAVPLRGTGPLTRKTYGPLLERPMVALMPIRSAATRLLAELEIPKELRRFGSGWISGTLALAAAVAALLMVVALRYPALLTHPEF